MEEPAADYHNLVISQLWSCISTPQVKNQTADTDTLIGLIRMEYGNDSVKDSGLIDGHQKYEVDLSNVRFHIVKLPHSYIVSAARPEKKIRYISCQLPKDMITYMSAFDEVIPKIIKHIEQNVSERTRKAVLRRLVRKDQLPVKPSQSKTLETIQGLTAMVSPFLLVFISDIL